MTGSDTPTFSIAETTRTNHFSLLLRKLPNRNQTKTEPKPTLKSKLILHLLKTEKKSITVLIFKVKIHDTPLINLYNCMHWSNEYHDAHKLIVCFKKSQKQATEPFGVRKFFVRTNRTHYLSEQFGQTSEPTCRCITI